MRISVVTVVLNAREKIAATIDSVVGQTFSGVELVVIDGGSSDGTLDIVHGYGNRIDQLIVERDRGIYDAMNKGMRVATGEWLIFMNAGDVFADERVLESVASLLRDPRPVLCGGFVKVWGSQAVSFRPRRLGVGQMPTCHQAMFVRTEVAKQYPFDLSLRVGADYDQVCSIARDDPANIMLTDMTIARVEGDGFSSMNARVAYKDCREIVRRHHGWGRAWLWYLRIVAWTSATSIVKRVLPAAVTGRARRLRNAASSLVGG